MNLIVIVVVIAVAAGVMGVTPSGFSWGRSGPRIYFRFGRSRRRSVTRKK
jgi:hypothetical protein